MEDSSADSRSFQGISARILFVAWGAGVLAAFACEATRFHDRLIRDATPGKWWQNPSLDGTFLLPLLMLGPFCWMFPCVSSRQSCGSLTHVLLKLPLVKARVSRLGNTGWFRWLACAGVTLLSLAMTVHVAHRPVSGLPSQTRAGDLFPSLHDEFSYQLQARTFLAGRWHWSGPSAAPEIFHQTHVLNEGKFASRYFPGTGLWLAPWEALGHAVWGQWLAGMLIAAGMFWIGCELGGPLVGTLAGVLIALSPGMALLGNLLVAHHATLAGLVLFIGFFLRWMRDPQPRWALLAGIGLACAMLCRPLTAAAIGFPFGIWLVWRVVSDVLPSLARTHTGTNARTGWIPASLAAMGAPLLLGFGLLAWQNTVLTGSPWMTPYSQYTSLYTPRHVFGFHNGDAVSSQPAKVLADYDAWAENLTPAVAGRNVAYRLWGSWCWSLAGPPLAMAATVAAFTWNKVPTSLRLLLAAIASLHVAHVPYWLDGLLDHHYVFESGPLWLLWSALLSVQLLRDAVQSGRWLFVPWWGAVILLSAGQNFLGIHGTPARIDQGVQLLRNSGEAARVFHQLLKQEEFDRPALILVRVHPRDVHGEFIRNVPGEEAELLVGRHRPELYPLDELQRFFPERHLYLYDTSQRSFASLASPEKAIAQQGSQP